jgi:hypothetical protein
MTTVMTERADGRGTTYQPCCGLVTRATRLCDPEQSKPPNTQYGVVAALEMKATMRALTHMSVYQPDCEICSSPIPFLCRVCRVCRVYYSSRLNTSSQRLSATQIPPYWVKLTTTQISQRQTRHKPFQLLEPFARDPASVGCAGGPIK